MFIYSAPILGSLWDMDINSSIPKLDPMHVEVSTFITQGRDEEAEEAIKQEEYLPGDEIYVQSSGYHEAVFSLPPGDHSGHCDTGPAYTYTLTCSGQLGDPQGQLNVKYSGYRGHHHHDHHHDHHSDPGLDPGAGYSGQGAPVPVISHAPLPPHEGPLSGGGARHTPPPPYNNSQYSASFSPCSSSSSSLSPPINVSTR